MQQTQTLIGMLFAALLFGASAAQAQIGNVQFAFGDVRLIGANGAARTAPKGTSISEGDTVVVGPQASAQLKMIDGGLLAVRPDTQMKFDEYRWSGKEDGKERGLMSLARGGFRTITGAIGRLNKGNYRVTTPTATVGIRGTDHEVAHIPVPTGPAGLPAGVSPGTYDKVNVGSAIITAQGVTVVVQPNQVGYAAVNAPPRILPAVPAFLRATPPPRQAAAPAAQGQQQAQQGEGQGSGDPVRASSVVDSPAQVADASATAVRAATIAPVDAGFVAVPAISSPALTTAPASSVDVGGIPIVALSSTGSTLNLTEQTTAAAPKVSQALFVSYYYWPNSTKIFGSETNQAAQFDDIKSTVEFGGPGGNLSFASDDDRSLTVNFASAAASAVSAKLSNGIFWGQYSSASTGLSPNSTALTISGKDHQSTFTNRELIGVFHWISAPQLTPVFVSSVSRGTASYTVLGHSLPTNQNGATGSLNSATFGVNFDRQYLDATVDFNLTGNHWVATASQVRFDDGGGFHASSGSSHTYAHNNMSVNVNGSPVGFGQMQGAITGPNMNGAVLAYTLAANLPAHEHANGTVAFGTPSFSNSASAGFQPYLLRLGARGTVAGFNASTGAVSTANPAPNMEAENLALTRITALDPARTKFNGNELTEFDANSVTVSVNGTCPSQCFTNSLPTRIGIIASGSAASGALPAMPSITGAATVVESGGDATSGTRWGRYSNGNFAVVDRVTGSPVATGNFSPGPINHYLITGIQSVATVLPVSGTFNYTLMGHTSPTDSAGNVGVLNSATLAANFTAQTVNIAVNATVGPRTWTASANNVAILAGLGFEVQRFLGNGGLTVGCTGTGCTTTNSGSISGGFAGATGETAGIAYSLNSGGLTPGLGGTGVSMGGVAAFKR